MTTTREVANLVAAVHARHRQGLAADMVKLRTKFGSAAVAEAQQLLRQQELYAGLSASADRHRRHAMRMANDQAQQLFRKAHDE
jgi:hypothetical protein